MKTTPSVRGGYTSQEMPVLGFSVAWHGACFLTIACLVCTLVSGSRAVSKETADTTSHKGQVGSLIAESGRLAAIICNASRLGANQTQDSSDRLDWTDILRNSFQRVITCLIMQGYTEQRVCERCTPSRWHQALCSPIVKIFREFFSWVLRSVSTDSENAVAQCNDVDDRGKWVKHEALQMALEFARISTAPGHLPLPFYIPSSAVCHASPGRNILTTCQHLPVDTPCQDLLLKRVTLGFLHGWVYAYVTAAGIGRQYAGSSAPVSLFSNASSDDLASSLGCWEPELRATASLFSRPGRWDVSMRCIDVLQVIAKQITDKVIRTWLSMLIKIDTTTLGKSLHSIVHAILTILPRLFDALSDRLYQKHLYPIFNRLKKTAELRSQQHTGTSPVTVSCRGLKGRSRDVHSTLVRLYRITIIGELSLSSFFEFLVFRVAYSPINTFLPCLIASIV